MFIEIYIVFLFEHISNNDIFNTFRAAKRRKDELVIYNAIFEATILQNKLCSQLSIFILQSQTYHQRLVFWQLLFLAAVDG